MMREHTNGGAGAGSVLLAFLTGAAIGGVVALLLAPRSGEETRRRIFEFGEDAKEKLGKVPVAVREAEKAAVSAFNDTMKKA
ncbi:MAG TPA: YtxH domain-containing protein [Anaeromyxobacteraceae bacterium]|nr:YtxH domain-containing protein [Anaeromyxobacteraceae bacterium]